MNTSTRGVQDVSVSVVVDQENQLVCLRFGGNGEVDNTTPQPIDQIQNDGLGVRIREEGGEIKTYFLHLSDAGWEKCRQNDQEQGENKVEYDEGDFVLSRAVPMAFSFAVENLDYEDEDDEDLEDEDEDEEEDYEDEDLDDDGEEDDDEDEESKESGDKDEPVRKTLTPQTA